MPLTPNGKLDRRALPTPTRHRATHAMARPRTPLERQMLEVWQETLGVSPIGIHDSFFDMGGHSLLAIQLLANLQAVLKQPLPLRTLFASPTIARLAASLKGPQPTAPSTTVVPLQPLGTQPPLVCVPGAGGSPLYLYTLAQAMGPQHPFYALEAVGLDDQQAPFKTVEAAATYRVSQLQRHRARQQQGTAPYY